LRKLPGKRAAGWLTESGINRTMRLENQGMGAMEQHEILALTLTVQRPKKRINQLIPFPISQNEQQPTSSTWMDEQRSHTVRFPHSVERKYQT
jgi:hypothetical protein